MNRQLPLIVILLIILALAVAGTVWAAGLTAPVAKLGQSVKGAIEKGVIPGHAAKKPAKVRGHSARGHQGQSGPGHGSYKSWQRSHGWHAGLPSLTGRGRG